VMTHEPTDGSRRTTLPSCHDDAPDRAGSEKIHVFRTKLGWGWPFTGVASLMPRMALSAGLDAPRPAVGPVGPVTIISRIDCSIGSCLQGRPGPFHQVVVPIRRARQQEQA